MIKLKSVTSKETVHITVCRLSINRGDSNYVFYIYNIIYDINEGQNLNPEAFII